MKWDILKQLWKKGKFVILILLTGVILMLLPSGKQDTSDEGNTSYSLEETEQRIEQTLGKMEGVGRIDVMLTLKSSSQLTLAEDRNDTQRQDEKKIQSEILTINRGSGYQDVIVTEEIYPLYQGAVVVCDGAQNSSVRLQIMETVSALTGLGSDKISVVQRQS